VWLIAFLTLWGFVIAQGVVIIALLRVFTGLHQRLEEQAEPRGVGGLTSGNALVDRDFIGLGGETIVLSSLWQRGNLLLSFVSVNCAPCRTLLAWIGDAFRNGQLRDWDICVLCTGRETQVRKFLGEIEFPREIPVAALEHEALRRLYQIEGTPTLAIVEEAGRITDVVAGEAIAYLEVLTRRSTFRIPV
jgi:hypothetical protein